MPRNTNINTDLVKHFYNLNKSDREISELLGVTKTSIAHLRKRLGIPTRVSKYTETYDLSRSLVKARLQEEFKHVHDLRSSSKTSRYDFLVNRVVRVQVYGSRFNSDIGKWSFIFAKRKEEDISSDNKYFIQLNNGKWVKDFSKSCDVIVLCGLEGDEGKYFIIPSSSIPKARSAIGIHKSLIGRWGRFLNNWKLIHDIALKKTKL